MLAKCQELRPSRPQEPLVMTHANERMDQVGVDLFHEAGVNYLCMVDRYSGYPFVQCLGKGREGSTTTDVIFKHL